MRIRIQLFTIKKADPDPVSQRDGEYNGDFVTFRTEGSMQDITATKLQSTRVQTTLSSLSFKCNVLRESLSVDSQNIPCATLKRRGSWVILISVDLCSFQT
jgi:hypothetical protein